MAITITETDVVALCPEASALSSSAIQLYIDMVAQADQCLDDNNVPLAVQKFLKTSAVCHFISRAGGGTIKSESDMDGASVTFETYKVDGYGLASTVFGQNLLSSGYRNCFAFMDAMPNRFMTAVGR